MTVDQTERLLNLDGLKSAVEELENSLLYVDRDFALADPLDSACKKVRSLLDKLSNEGEDETKSKLIDCLMNEYFGYLSWLIVQKVKLWNRLSKEAKKLLISAGISYMPEVYLDKERAEKATNKRGDNFLHVIGRAGNVDALIYIYGVDDLLSAYKHGRVFMFDYIGMSNIDGHTPLHELVLSGKLHEFIEKITDRIDTRYQNAKTKNGDKRKEYNCLIAALSAQDKDGRSPLSILSASPKKKKIEELCGMQTSYKRMCSFIRRNRSTCHMLCAIICVAVFCVALYHLYLVGSLHLICVSVATASMGGAVSSCQYAFPPDGNTTVDDVLVGLSYSDMGLS